MSLDTFSFQQVPPPACKQSWKFCWNPKSIRLHFTLVATKKSLLTFVGSKRTAFVETNLFFDPVGPDVPIRFLTVYSWLLMLVWGSQETEISSLGALNIKWHLRKLDPYKQHWKWKGDHHVIHETGDHLGSLYKWDICIFKLYCFKKCKSSQFSPQIVEVTRRQKTAPRSNIRWEQIFVDTQLGCMVWLVDRCWIYVLVRSVMYIGLGNDTIVWFEYDSRCFSWIIIDIFFVSWHA